MAARTHCKPPFWPHPGHENATLHSVSAGKIFYVVRLGYVRGLFTHEPTARAQVEGFSNGRWRKAKNWNSAMLIWNEYCDELHQNGCPPFERLEDVATACSADTSSAPTTPAAVWAHNEHVVFSSLAPTLRSTPIPPAKVVFASPASTLRSTPIPPAKPFSLAAESPPTPRNAPGPSVSPASPRPQTHPRPQVSPRPHASGTPRRRAPAAVYSDERPPRYASASSVTGVHPFKVMDAAEAFSRMGVATPSINERPIKQWAIAGVNMFFPTRLDALNHIFDTGRTQSMLMSSRNVRKLRAFSRGEEYVLCPGEVDYDDGGN
ncbi:hypothetical protein B0H11DRAFT_2257582 [Mycena galericulata]|nr:hypothetical protein B0H11DRAFT_2257582 [Mycena galericulata]